MRISVFIFTIFLLCFSVFVIGKGGPMNKTSLPCRGSGRWFPADKTEIASMINLCLSNKKEFTGRPVAIISPHAGYVYSGEGAGYAFSTLKNRDFERAIIIGPSHQKYFEGISIVDGYSHYNTPLGDVELDLEFISKIRENNQVQSIFSAHKMEHSVENQIPFIQTVLPNTKIVPIITGVLSIQDAKELAQVIKSNIDEKTIFIISSDFTHYGNAFGYLPFKNDIRNNLEKLDFGAMNHILKGDPTGFISYIEKTDATICGKYPILLLLSIFKDSLKGEILKYYTSSDDSNDFSHTVCYSAIVLELNE